MKPTWSSETLNYLCQCSELDETNFILFPPAVQMRNLYFASYHKLLCAEMYLWKDAFVLCMIN
jgi:hypothetical protein